MAGLFEPWIAQLDPNDKYVDLLFFDGASNVQKGGEIMAATHPGATVVHGGEHATDLFFSDVVKMWQVRLIIKNYRRIYRVFGTGSMHVPYAMFMKEAQKLNKGE